MFTETIGGADASNGRSRRYLMSFFIALALALTMYASKAEAQLDGSLEVNIPFEFHAGEAKLPAGEYRIHVLDDSQLEVMEISSMNGSAHALFQVHNADANAASDKTELIFNKYGNRYFLTKLFEEGRSRGSQVIESRYEKTVSQKEAMEAQVHVRARHGEQRGN
jgi:hypothetical protein